MLDSMPILSLITFFPLIGILILAFIPKHNGKWIKIVAVAATLIPLILSGWLYADFNHESGELQFTEEMTWLQLPLNKEALGEFQSYSYLFKYKLAVDGVSLPMVFLTALVASMAALASAHIKKRWKAYYIWFLLLEAGMFGVFMAQDLFLFFVFFEITLVPMFFLVGIWGFRDREKAANKFLIYNGIGSAIMLLAFLIIVNTAGFELTTGGKNLLGETQAYISYSGDLELVSANLSDPSSLVNQQPQQGQINPFYLSDTLRWALFIMLLVAFGIKLPLFPFHTWMLRVHTEAPPPIVMIHSGILLKMGAYGLIRFGVLLFPEQAKAWAFILAVLGVINILYGAVLAFRQHDFRLILAYSSISHMGIVLLGLAAFNEIGLQGAVFQMVSHGLISALMFLIVGSIYERTATTMINELGGLAKTVPFISGILLISGMASLGLPGLSGFISEFLAFLGLFGSMPVVTAVGALGIIMTAVYVLRGVMRITFGQTSDRFAQMKDARLIEAIPMITLVAFIVLLGVYPAVLSEPLQHTVDAMIQNVSSKIGG
jgi:NADH-quinone oxidoreductase subunit M